MDNLVIIFCAFLATVVFEAAMITLLVKGKFDWMDKYLPDVGKKSWLS